ncbi:MAG: kynureninase [Acidobacteriota bacterium]
MPPIHRSDCAALDAADELAWCRDEFLLPEGVVYLDGNSLGALPRRTPERLRRLVEEEWGRGLIRSWNAEGWVDLALRLGAAIAPLVGAGGDEVVVADSTSVNLFKLLAAALRMRRGRREILTDADNFPTDLYVAQGVADLLGGVEVRAIPRARLPEALDERVAVLMLTHVDFRTGEVLDAASLTAAAHRAGALALWDLAHSAGALPVRLVDWGADMAVGCGYKYLNGGPGAPSFAFVARRLQPELRQPLWGWFGHRAPFDFSPRYLPAEGIASLQSGTPPVVGLAALECGVATIARAGVERLRRKSVALTELFTALLDQEFGGRGIEVVSPRDPERRGSQVSIRHAEGYALTQALIARGVIPDFRAPDLIRFGFAPAYLRHVDVFDAVAALSEVVWTEAWRRPEFLRRARVT